MNAPTDFSDADLIQLLFANFDQDDFGKLCRDLNVEYDHLMGSNLEDKINSLVNLLAEQERLPELVTFADKRRPGADWTAIRSGLEQGADDGSEEKKPESTPVKGGPKFNIRGDINAAQINLGGQQTITGPIHVDMQETVINQPNGEVVMGDKIEMSGDFRGAIVNVKSRLDNVKQTIKALPHGDDAQKAQLIELVNELQGQLEEVPQDRISEAEKVTKRVEALTGEINEQEPDKEMIEITGESLKRAANNLKDVLPTVLLIAGQIVSHALRFTG